MSSYITSENIEHGNVKYVIYFVRPQGVKILPESEFNYSEIT